MHWLRWCWHFPRTRRECPQTINKLFTRSYDETRFVSMWHRFKILSDILYIYMYINTYTYTEREREQIYNISLYRRTFWKTWATRSDIPAHANLFLWRIPWRVSDMLGVLMLEWQVYKRCIYLFLYWYLSRTRKGASMQLQGGHAQTRASHD